MLGYNLISLSVLLWFVNFNNDFVTGGSLNGSIIDEILSDDLLNDTCNDGNGNCDKNGNDRGHSLLYGNKQFGFNKDILRHTSIIYGLISVADSGELSEICYSEMQKIYDGINNKEIWAMKVLDASGNQESGFMWGHNHWIGSQKGCESARTPLSITLSTRYDRHMKSNLVKAVAPFDVEYRVVYAKHQSAWQVEVKFLGENILHVGLCVPRSCSNEELHNLSSKYFDERIIQAQDVFEFNAEVLQVKDMHLRDDFYNKTSVVIVIAIFFVTITLCIQSSGQEHKTHEKPHYNEQNYTVISSTTTPSYLRESPASDEKLTERSVPVLPKEKTFSEKVLHSFNVKNNLSTIFETQVSPQSIPAICGIKTIACFLILTFHMQWYTFFTLHNTSVMFHYAEQIQFQFVSNAPLLVDVFFTISGFLVAYNFVKNKSRMTEIKNNNTSQNLKLYGKLLLHRYLRLSPLYLIINALGEIVTTYVVDKSTFWVHERSDLNCQKYWWRNILYIQNLFHVDELCLNWTWSMACEMQYFLIFTAMLFLYAKNARLGKSLFCVTAVFTLVFSLALTMYLEFMPSYDVLYNTGTALYIAPWSRIAPYFVGIYFGWLLAKTQGNLKISKFQIRLSWTMSCLFIFLSMHSTIKRDFPFYVASIVIVLGRWILALSTAWIILASVSGNDNWLTKFLSAKFFVHVNKLTYAIYLLNPLIITLVFGLSEGSSSADPIPAIVMALGITLLSYLAAILFSVLFEIPYCIISSEILKKETTKKVN